MRTRCLRCTIWPVEHLPVGTRRVIYGVWIPKSKNEIHSNRPEPNHAEFSGFALLELLEATLSKSVRCFSGGTEEPVRVCINCKHLIIRRHLSRRRFSDWPNAVLPSPKIYIIKRHAFEQYQILLYKNFWGPQQMAEDHAFLLKRTFNILSQSHLSGMPDRGSISAFYPSMNQKACFLIFYFFVATSVATGRVCA